MTIIFRKIRQLIKKKLTLQLIKEIRCITCYKISNQLYSISCCSQYLCMECNKKIQQCPLCKQKYEIFNNKSVLRILDYITCECSNEQCNYKSQFLEVLKHQETCEFQKRTCKVCHEIYLQKDIYDHMINNHKKDIMQQLTYRTDQI
ncbi:hypothetical protein TTHERM_000419929 (macronuclear) [Tetrahymena thermophila SB210]|uniref:RING-type domain-containing protein n=1 Tax=Tetrahymena thermophila (strain SB210) TaxID=312017 RepID=W7X0I7_TETTS|nr:hypothetical protein TTHERM_000419929 [Tetrahymena thermophila SB210]EWS72640.1 hypothetical protein TTHERM_000419929 [Tetrahymena thermophila SB210]|eukprot:XP_012654808.1 hypothetical protein TTHERM_000419929 [Tetrahymena thermophila SB210]